MTGLVWFLVAMTLHAWLAVFAPVHAKGAAEGGVPAISHDLPMTAVKGQNVVYDLSRFGGYIGPNYNTPTTGSMSSGSQTLTIANPLDFANGQGIVVLGAGPATSLSTPTGVIASPLGVTGRTTYYYAVVDEDYANGRTPASAPGGVSEAVATLGIQTVTDIACNRVSGVVTCTTPRAHNFVNGSQVELPRGTSGDWTFEGVFTITSVPNSTTFTFTQYGAQDKSGIVTTGTARVVGRVQVKWNITTAFVMKHLIYRCLGRSSCSLPANATNYKLVGVSIGLDSSFVDCGYAFNAASLDNGDAPVSAPTTASRQWLPTTIAAGGGTTTLTLAKAAKSSVSGVKVAHDNAPVLLNACGAIGATHQGAVILVPSLGSTSGTNYFPISSTMNGCGGVEIDFGSPVWANAPIAPGGGATFKGIAGGNNGQLPPFYNVSQTALIDGFAYPFFFMSLPTSGNLSLEGFLMQCYQPYQSCVVQDETPDSSAVVSIRYKDVHLEGYAAATPLLSAAGSAFSGMVADGRMGLRISRRYRQFYSP